MKDGKTDLFHTITLYPVPLIASTFPLQKTFGSLKVDVLQVPHVCQWSVWE